MGRTRQAQQARERRESALPRSDRASIELDCPSPLADPPPIAESRRTRGSRSNGTESHAKELGWGGPVGVTGRSDAVRAVRGGQGLRVFKKRTFTEDRREGAAKGRIAFKNPFKNLVPSTPAAA